MRRYLPFAREGMVVVLLCLLVALEGEIIFKRQVIHGSFRNTLWNVGLVTPWTMFTGPQVNRGWIIVFAKGEDGSVIDLLTGKPPVWSRADFSPQRYSTMRWAKFYFASLHQYYNLMYKHLAVFYGRRWMREHPDRPLAYVKIINMWKPTLPMYNTIRYKPWILGEVWLKTPSKKGDSP